jgi:hypothetical protein
LTDILNDPPRFIVTAGDEEPFVPDFPELRELRERYYVETGKYRLLHVYQLRGHPLPRASSGRTP